MDERLLAAFLRTDYRVRLDGGGWAGIRIGQALPAALRPIVGTREWGFLTAWNPRSRPQPRQHNRQAQRQLLRALRELAGTQAIRAAVGVGEDGWREHSLFAVGPARTDFDALARRFGQHGYVHGQDGGPAQLRLFS